MSHKQSSSANIKSSTPAQDPLWPAFNEALTHQGAGRLTDAERIYRKILEINPRHAHTLHMMGLMALDLKKYDVAEELVRRAMAEQEGIAFFHGSLGNILKIQEKYEEAAVEYRKALELKPDYADILSNLGATLLNLGQQEEALELFMRAVKANPNHFNALNNIGVIFQKQKKDKEAREYFEKAIVARPGFAEAYKNIGLLLKYSGSLKESVTYFEQAIKYKPDYVDAISDLANVLRDMHKYDDAKKYYEQAASLRLDGFALANIASILKQQGKVAEALTYYERALALSPDSFEILNNLGIVQNDIGKYKEATETYKKAVALQPSEGVTLSNLGTALKNLGQLDQSLDYLKRAIALSPDHVHVYGNLLLTMVYASSVSPEELMATAQKFGEAVRPLLRQRPFPNDKTPERKLRIGYVSPDFFNHSVNYFFEPLLKLHDKSQFEIFAYSNTANEDKVTERLKPQFDHWRDIRFINNSEAADMIEADKIDILVDMSGHTGKNRILVFAQKPAPVQVTWLGYPATTGIEAIDYRITDNHAEPRGMTEHLSVETLWRLPEIFCCYQPHENSPAVIDHPPFEDNGLITFGCFNNFSKVTDEVLLAWGKIMARVPDSRLLLEIAGIQEREFHADVTQRLQRAGVPVERVLLEPRKPSNQFTLYNKIDMALDPFPCNGGTTSMDTLWMGVPFVTLEGRHFVSRMGITILKNAGLPELIAKNTDEYIDIAVSIANDRDRLKKLRHGLREKVAASPVMNQKNFTRNIEAAYREMWRKYCAEQ